jgi:Na+/H+ antiporter NhaA
LLAVFFFVAGLELKREVVAGISATRAGPPCPLPRPSGA